MEGTERDNRRFQRSGFGGSGTYECRACGKKTRETGQDESSAHLCRECNAIGLTENTHSDFGHPGTDSECAECARNFVLNGGKGSYAEARARKY